MKFWADISSGVALDLETITLFSGHSIKFLDERLI